MANVRWNWYGPQLIRQVRDETISRLHTIGGEVRDQMRRNVGIQVFPRSLPGHFPHRETGDLQSKIDYEVDEHGRESGGALNPAAYVVSGSTHALALELGTGRAAPRPFMVRTLVLMRERIKRVLVGPMNLK